jgi:hypothetical protein
MERTKVVAGISALLTTVAEFGTAPDGICFAALSHGGFSFDEYQAIRGALIRAGYLTLAGHVLTVTDSGKAKANEINAAVVCQGEAKGDGYPGTRYFHGNENCPGHD